MKRLAVLLLALHVLAQDQPTSPHGCKDGSCYPATGNLLIGRAVNLTATSTCGLKEPEHYCIVSHLKESDKCFTCNSKKPYDPYHHKNSHRVENVIYLKDSDTGALTWWQSVNGEENVSLQLNLEAEFHFTHLIMKFKTFRPAGMLIERSVDFGRSWRPYRYFAYNCSKTFPGVRTRHLHHINDVICEERYSDIEPSTEGEVIFKVLDPAITVSDPYSANIQDLLRITNLRINFTKLHTLGDNLLDRRPDVLQKYYYAVYELVVRGSCFCYGHASECFPVPGFTSRDPGMIHGRCMCKHNTVGLNCERCKDFHHDLPWRPAEADNPHTCRVCNCNNHSHKCHFDMAVYRSTGNVSGGVCEDCLHNTMGRSCEICKPYYYQDPNRDIRDSAACVPCDCERIGSRHDGACDSHTDPDRNMISGQCRCKPNVRGHRCDSCKEGHYGLSENDPLGCQSCNCDPRGTTMMGPPCDQISGDCFCKQYVTGRYCSQCIPEYWGLSNDMKGCRPCDCDFGGAYSNKCSMDNGQCECRSHLIGRQCSDVESGYFCAALDYLTYEAEGAKIHSPDDSILPGTPRPQAGNDCIQLISNQLRRLKRHKHIAQQQRAALRRIRQLQQTPDVSIVQRERHAGQIVTWTGPGFARVKDGAGLVFTIENIPYAMEYDVMIRYEPESTEDWEAVVHISVSMPTTSHRCGNLLPTEQYYTVTLPHYKRHVHIPRPFCFEPNNRYVIAIRFQRRDVSHRHLTAFVLVDSLVLIPKYEDLPGFQGSDPLAVQRREGMVRYMCLDSFMSTPMPALAEMCIKYICSISSIMHNKALACSCSSQGSISAECKKIGGQCLCKTNVIGRNCDQCAPRTYGFGPYGCIACNCHLDGSEGQQCNLITGECPCKPGAYGRQCSECQPGYWGFPNCRPCQCNGHTETCDPQTGVCLNCRDQTGGQFCESCVNGFYGNPILGSGEHCRPCPCPGNPGSGHSNGDSCHMDTSSSQIICDCKQGYTGSRCDHCAPGYYGNPNQLGGECRPCQCNRNIETEDPESCDPHTGRCQKCLYNTDGSSCSECKPGYFGNALVQDCRRCTCTTLGTEQASCDDRVCYCDTHNGTCPCKPNVIGHNCDHCAPDHWNMGTGEGCEPCSCHQENSHGQHCNLISGQCQCRPGFGGRNCNECEQFHWGDPREHCERCRCSELGSTGPQCNRVTGACECREGASGPHCDECDRGFTGSFPKCVPCHPCFNLWDTIVNKLGKDLDAIRNTVDNILEMGELPGISDARISELEQMLAEVQKLLQNGSDGDQMFQLISQGIDNLRAEIAITDGHLLEVNEELNVTANHNKYLKQNLTSMEQELMNLNNTLAQRQKDLENYISGGIADQLDTVRKYYEESVAAELRCNASVYGAQSPVEQSQQTRNLTEALLKETKDRLIRTVTAQNKSLSELQKKEEELNKRINRLSQKVCGSSGNVSANGTCLDNTCGGTGCSDDNGTMVCGGPLCNGTVGESHRALDQAEGVHKNLTAISEDLMSVTKRLQDIATLTENVKAQAMNTLDKAQKKKEFFEKSNKDLKDFIQSIRDFLTEEGADPESIEKIAQQVLAITLPVNQTVMKQVVQEIKDSTTNLTDVDRLYNYTNEQLTQAKELLNRAIDAKAAAEGINDNINKTKETINITQEAIKKAENAIDEAMENLNCTQSTMAKVESKLSNLEANQTDLMSRLANLSKGVEYLRNKTEQNRLQAEEAKNLSDKANQTASELNEDLAEVESRYNKLNETFMSLGGTAIGNVSQKALDLKNEAESLLKKANKDMETLKRLERKLQKNEQRMQEQRDELRELETNVTDIRNFIREKVSEYINC